MSRAEQAIWSQLRNRGLSGFKFKRQWTLGTYVVDFCCIDRGLIVEIDGGQHTPERDSARTAALNRLGYRVIRFWNNEVLGNLDGVLTSILLELETAPHPNPLPRTGEGA
jgi:very-short-patch-repair endonuclease